MIKSDYELQEDVTEELAFDPSLDSTKIGVAAKDGVVTLTGTVASYPEKAAAERAAKRVAGVHGIAEELKIEMPASDQRSDADIAQAALRALQWDVTVPRNRVTVRVEGGWLTLEGELNWPFQRDAAKRAVEHLWGVRGVTNAIGLRTMVFSGDVKEKIRSAFERAAEIDANKLEVEIHNSTVTLRGDVHSWNEFDEAELAALSVPGVMVVNNLTQVT
ncbi:MAG: BON domain-containing protein [Candidatus Lustribacter sp.]|jgi:osmotically-inducible protein OsmY